MGDFRRLRNGLAEFKEARKKRDGKAQLRAASEIMRGAENAFSDGFTASDADAATYERDRHICLGMVADLEGVAAEESRRPGAAGPPWDGTLLRIILEFIKQFLMPR